MRKIRGLLCHKCNNGIGLLGDNLDAVIARLIAQLTRYRNQYPKIKAILEGIE